MIQFYYMVKSALMLAAFTLTVLVIYLGIHYWGIVVLWIASLYGTYRIARRKENARSK